MHAFVPAPRVRRVAAALAAGLALVLATPLAAGAQVTDEGHVKIEASHPAGGTDVHFIVRVTDKRDEPGNEALVTATPILADGEPLAPVRLSPADTDGRYEGIVAFPNAGQYTLRVTTVGPDARIEQPVTVTVSASTTPTTAARSGTTGSVPDSAFAPADDGTGASAANKHDGGVPTLAILLLAIVIIAGVTAAVVVLRRASPAAGGDGGGRDDADPAEASDASGGDTGEGDTGEGDTGATAGTSADHT